MQFSLNVPNFGLFGTPGAVADLARDAESAGWHGLFIWDHVARPTRHDVVDPWIALAAAATVTERIRLGAMVTPLPRRRPWIVARTTVSLDQLSNGRLIFGAGIGSGRPEEWASVGDETDAKVRGAMLDEGLTILDGLWRGEPFNYHGAYYDIGDAHYTPTPVQQPRIPVWIGGSWPNKAPMRRAAKWDGVFPLIQAENDAIDDLTRQLRDLVAFIQDERETDAPFDVATLGVPTPGDDPDRAAEIAAAFAEAGATWFMESLSPWRFGVDWEAPWPADQIRARVLAGPPKIG